MVEQVKMDFESQPHGSKPAVKQLLDSAARLARSNDPGAESAFVDVESAVAMCADPELQMEVFEVSGDFHFSRGRTTMAGEKYSMARQSALLLANDGGFEAEQRLRYKRDRTQCAHDPIFKNLTRAKQPSDSYERLNAAWASYQKEKEASQGRLAARGLGSVEDFRRRLDLPWCTADDEDGATEEIL